MTSTGRKTGRKRGHHEGHISWFEPRKCYRASIMVDGRRKWVYAKTRSATSDKLDQVKQELLDGSLPDGAMTLEAFSSVWLEGGYSNWALKTFQNREYLFRVHINPVIGRRRLDRLQVGHVQDLYTGMVKAGSSASLVNHAHRVLHTCLQAALRSGYLSRNVSSLTERPTVPQVEKPRLSESEIRDLLDAASGKRLEALFVLGLTSGARISELLGLTWDSVLIDRQEVRFVKQLKKAKGGGFELGELKTKSSRRVVEIGDIATQVLKTHRLRQQEERILAGPAWQGWDLVFCSRIGSPLSRENVRNNEWQLVLQEADIGRSLKLHNMRDIFASMMLGRGMNLATVSQMLGHRDPSTTLKHYFWAIPNSGRDVATAMDALIDAAS